MKKKETVLITGASRGIGRETARLFAEEGYQVVINYNTSEEKAASLLQELDRYKDSVLAVRADVSSATQVKGMWNEVKATFGSVDILINNAGIARQMLFTECTEQEWDRMFDVNVKGMFHCCREALPDMIHQKKGNIINISSIWGITGASCEVPYSATKAAVIGFTKALAKEMGPSGIRVNCVAPGVIETEMNSSLDSETIAVLKDETPLGVIGTPRDIANSILFLASSKADFMTGQVLSPNGGFLI